LFVLDRRGIRHFRRPRDVLEPLPVIAGAREAIQTGRAAYKTGSLRQSTQQSCDSLNSLGARTGIIRLNINLYDVSVWILPLVIAITFHEAAHGFVAHRLGDNTAWQLGRVTFNPLKHIDPFGTLMLPAMLLFAHSPFLFGYAKPVPVNFRALNNPRLDMVFVALAGPATNILLAFTAALAFHALPFAPANASQWIADNLKNALILNVVLAVFNMLPIPPLDGGRVAVGLLPRPLAAPLARLEPIGMLILIGILIVLPLAGSQFGLNLDVVSAVLRTATDFIIRLLLVLTGNA
jgi:Zn-dependent protease